MLTRINREAVSPPFYPVFLPGRGLARALRADRTGHLARRAREVALALQGHDARARAFAALLPDLLRGRVRPGAAGD